MSRNSKKSQEAVEERTGGGISLAPLSFGEAVAALLSVKPGDDRPKKRGRRAAKQDKPERPED